MLIIISDDNDFIDNDIHYPIVTGVGMLAYTSIKLLTLEVIYNWTSVNKLNSYGGN